MDAAGGALRNVTAAARGAENTPRYSPNGEWLSYLSMERPGFEADRQRLMLMPRSGGATVEATKGWTLSVGGYSWCPDSKCVYAVVEGGAVHSIGSTPVVSLTAATGGVNTGPTVAADGITLAFLRRACRTRGGGAGKALTHHTTRGWLARPAPLRGWIRGRAGDQFGWL
jgi:hypothetical protein